MPEGHAARLGEHQRGIGARLTADHEFL